MAAVFIPPFFASCTISWALSGKSAPVTCTLGMWDASGAIGASGIADDVAAAFEMVGGYCDPDLFSSNWTFLGVECVYNDDGTLVGGASSTVPYSGTAGAYEFPPVNCTFLVQKRTASVGRSKRGRMYLPNIMTPENNINVMGILAPGIAKGIRDDAWNTTAADLLDGPPLPVVLHQDPLEVPTIITSLPILDTTSTQRRRLRN